MVDKPSLFGVLGGMLDVSFVIWRTLVSIIASQHGLQRNANRRHRLDRCPFVAQNVQADVAIAVDVRVDWNGPIWQRDELYLWAFDGIICADDELQSERFVGI